MRSDPSNAKPYVQQHHKSSQPSPAAWRVETTQPYAGLSSSNRRTHALGKDRGVRSQYFHLSQIRSPGKECNSHQLLLPRDTVIHAHGDERGDIRSSGGDRSFMERTSAGAGMESVRTKDPKAVLSSYGTGATSSLTQHWGKYPMATLTRIVASRFSGTKRADRTATQRQVACALSTTAPAGRAAAPEWRKEDTHADGEFLSNPYTPRLPGRRMGAFPPQTGWWSSARPRPPLD